MLLLSTILHLQHLLPLQRALPVLPRTPNSTQRKPSTVSSWGLREAAEPPGSRVGRGASGAPVPLLQPSSSVQGPRGPGVTCQELRGTPRRRTCGSGPGRSPARPVGPGTPHLGRRRKAAVRRRRAAPPPQTARACVRAAGGSVRASTASGAARGARAGRSRETAPPGRAGRLGLAAAGPALRPAPPSLACPGAGAAEPSPPLAQRTQGVRPRPWGRRAAEHAFRSGIEEPWLLRSDLSRRPELASNSPSSWLKSLLTRGVWPPP